MIYMTLDYQTGPATSGSLRRSGATGGGTVVSGICNRPASLVLALESGDQEPRPRQVGGGPRVPSSGADSRRASSVRSKLFGLRLGATDAHFWPCWASSFGTVLLIRFVARPGVGRRIGVGPDRRCDEQSMMNSGAGKSSISSTSACGLSQRRSIHRSWESVLPFVAPLAGTLDLSKAPRNPATGGMRCVEFSSRAAASESTAIRLMYLGVSAIVAATTRPTCRAGSARVFVGCLADPCAG